MEELRKFQKEVHQNAKNKGFWEDFEEVVFELHVSPSEEDRKQTLIKAVNLMMVGQKFDLIHSEIGEATEGVRHGNPPDDKIPEYNAAEAELADAMIRIFDLAEFMGWDVIGAMLEKAKYNTGRPYKHGKQS